jgi:hypothetical protein
LILPSTIEVVSKRILEMPRFPLSPPGQKLIAAAVCCCHHKLECVSGTPREVRSEK